MILRVKMQWLREELVFSLVAANCRFSRPIIRAWYASSALIT
jgi:hypothetical protein